MDISFLFGAQGTHGAQGGPWGPPWGDTPGAKSSPRKDHLEASGGHWGPREGQTPGQNNHTETQIKKPPEMIGAPVAGIINDPSSGRK